MVEATGTVHSIGEIGEQFAWIGAALRPFPREFGIVHSIPNINKVAGSESVSQTKETVIGAATTFLISFTVGKGVEQANLAPCQCWHNLFENPVLVQGYPIRRRSEYRTGLELPLHLMASLMGTQRVNVFQGKLFIKGYSSMLVPTRSTEDLLLWHLLQTKDGRSISYLDNPGPHATGITISYVKEARNVVGWCSHAQTFAGNCTADKTLLH
jgi:hypothetical protein